MMNSYKKLTIIIFIEGAPFIFYHVNSVFWKQKSTIFANMAATYLGKEARRRTKCITNDD
jgi:hypothetical protein